MRRVQYEMSRAWAVLVGGLALTLAMSAQAQTPPEQTKRQLIEMGWNYGPGNLTIYREQLANSPSQGVKVTKDMAYGDHARQKLDVYQGQGSGLPVMVFFHGGGYVGGARDTNEFVHANVLTYFALNGFLGINADFRLAPEFPWPSGGQDAAAVVRWVKQNAVRLGGDPERIYLFGTSAGASHVAQYVFDRRFQPSDGPGVAGAILQSGRYLVHSDPDDPSMQGGVMAYFGSDPQRYASRSSVNHVAGSTVPVMLLMSEYDQLNLAFTTGELFTALCKRDAGRCPRFIQLKYHNHASEYFHFNTQDDYLGREILEWVHEGFGHTRRSR